MLLLLSNSVIPSGFSAFPEETKIILSLFYYLTCFFLILLHFFSLLLFCRKKLIPFV